MAPQLGTGTIAVSRLSGGGPIAFIASHHNPAGGFRELIVARRGSLFVPVKVSDHTLSSVPGTYTHPSKAEGDIASMLGLTKRSQSDRWWVTSDAAAPVTSFPDPAASFSFMQVVAAKDQMTGDVSAVWAQFFKAGAAGRLDVTTLLTRPPGASPEVKPADAQIYSPGWVTVGSGAQFEGFAKSLMGPVDRYVLNEKISKISGAVPGDWL